MPANAFEGSTARLDKILNQKGSLSTATLRQELQNRLGADSVLDLVVFGGLAADTTVEFCTDAVVTLNVMNSRSEEAGRGESIAACER